MTQFRFPIAGVAAVVLAVATVAAQAAVLPLGTAAADPSNYATFSGQELQSVTLNGVTYATGDLTQITMTAFAAADRRTMAVPDTNDGPFGANPTAAERRSFIETDWLANTGLGLNPAAAADAFVADFNTPAVNLPGADMVLFEMGNGDDAFITINGQEVKIAKADFGNTGIMTGVIDLLQITDAGGTADIIPTSLDQLLNEPAKISSTSNINQAVYGVAIDFSDFGVAANATVDGFSLRSGGVDPIIIGAVVPEPATLSLLALGGLGFAARHRRGR